ncbi:MAG: Mu transposase C-terminal domain-containing protein [Maricaulaceae bacterium]|nr:Mu transposase C-terminal domain-containing protein [Maricaulaceae bacterium]
MKPSKADWFTCAELAALKLPGLPGTRQNIAAYAQREGWDRATDDSGAPLRRRRKGRGGGWEYSRWLLPEAARAELVLRRPDRAAPPAPANRDAAWARFDRLPQTMKDEAARRLALVARCEELMRAGLTATRAFSETVARAQLEARAEGRAARISVSTLHEWFGRLVGVTDHDRLAYLAPWHTGRTALAELPGEAFELYKADYLRQSRPSHAACYRNLQRVAEARGWTLPSARTLQRRLEAEIPAPVRTLKRLGTAALEHAYPYRARSRAGLAPMQVGNLDGHTWDVMVQWPCGTVSRPMSLAVQDVASGLITAIRFDLTLNHHLVRLALGDTFRDYGLFETLLMDNGRENTARAISGGQRRHRWGRTPEDEPAGLLTLLGVKAVPVTPYWGQAKPVERAFRDFAHEIAKRAEFEGAYTGHNTVSKPENYASRAIPFAEFEAIVRREIAHYNARPGRRGAGLNGRSFAEAFEDGVKRLPPRRATEEQLRLCLLASKPVLMDARDRAVSVEGNRYWSPALGALKRQRVIVRFDPERLDLPAYVYSLDGRLLAEAARIAAGSFDSVSDAREQRKAVRDYKRAVQGQAEALSRLTAMDVAAAAALAHGGTAPRRKARSAAAAPNVIRPAFGAPAAPERAGKTDEDFGEAWVRQVSRAGGPAE